MELALSPVRDGYEVGTSRRMARRLSIFSDAAGINPQIGRFGDYCREGGNLVRFQIYLR